MSSSEFGHVMGASPGEVAVHQLRTDARLKLRPGAADGLVKSPSDRVYLVLDHVRGTRDAAVLHVHLALPGDEASDRFMGAFGPYGLRRASAADGLQFSLDVTPFFEDFEGASEIIVSLRLRRELPVEEATVIGRVLLYRSSPLTS